MQLMDHQKAIIAKCLSQDVSIVAAGIGTGKTAIGIACLDEDKRSLIVCPASLKKNWAKEVSMWKFGAKVIDVKTAKSFSKPGIYLCSYNELADAWAYSWDIVVADEAHYLKNPLAKRTQLFYKTLRSANRKILMTATPVLNRVEEMHQLLKLCDLGNKIPSDPIALHNYLLKSGIYMRVKTKDVINLKDPVFSRTNIALKPTQDIQACEQEIRKAYEQSDNSIEKLFKDYRPMLVGKLSEIRKHVGIAKIAQSIKVIENRSNLNNSPIIVFAHHKLVLEAISKAFAAPIIYGKTSMVKRNKIVEEFQEGKHKIIVCSIQAAGVGLTLTRSHNVIFVEFPWTPAEYDQAWGRAHRKGQQNTVEILDVVSDNIVDTRHCQILKEKRFLCDGVIDGSYYESASCVQKKLVESIINSVPFGMDA